MTKIAENPAEFQLKKALRLNFVHRFEKLVLVPPETICLGHACICAVYRMVLGRDFSLGKRSLTKHYLISQSTKLFLRIK